MSGRKKPAPKNPSDALAAIREKLAAGRSMSALKEAKQLAKSAPGPEAEALLADAYEARIRELSEQKQHKEAAEVVGVARQRFPELAARWAAAEQGARHAAGDLSGLLAAWRDADRGGREELAATLRREVRDPAWIADSEVLPADDPLRAAAVAVREAFLAAAADRLDDALREALRAVGRRSPLQPWRSFVLALDAFHRRDDARALELLAGIEDDDAVAPGRDTLRAAMLAEPLPAEKAVRRAVRGLVGGIPELLEQVARLEQTGLSDDTYFDLCEEIARGLADLGGWPLIRFARWVGEEFGPGAALGMLDAAGVPLSRYGDEEPRLLALMSSSALDVVFGWSGWLQRGKPGGRGRTSLRALEPKALALALESMAAALPAVLGSVGRALGDRAYEEFLRGTSLAAQRGWIHDRDYGTQQDEIAMMVWVSFLSLYEALEEHTGERDRSPEPHTALLRQIATVEPTSERCERVLRAAGGDEDLAMADRERILDWWANLCPADPEPWLQRTHAQEDDGDYAAARQSLERARALAPVDPRVRRAEARIAMGQLHDAVAEPGASETLELLTEIASRPFAREPLLQAWLAALREVLEAPATVPLEELVEVPAHAEALRGWVRDLVAGRPFRVQRRNVAASLLECVLLQRVLRAAHLQDHGAPAGVDPIALRDANLPEGREDLLAVCELALAWRIEGLGQRAAVAGVLQDGPGLARFLAHYAKTAPANHTRRIRRARALARLHATREGDPEVHELLQNLWFHDEEPIEPGEESEVLEALRADLRRSQRTATRRRGKKVRQTDAGDPDRPRQRGLPFDMEEGRDA